MDWRKLGAYIIGVGLAVGLYGVMMILANQDVTYKNTGNAMTDLMRSSETQLGNLLKAGARAQGIKIMFWGIAIAVGGGIIRACAKPAGHPTANQEGISSSAGLAPSSLRSTGQSGQINADKEICPFCKEPTLKANNICEVCRRQKR